MQPQAMRQQARVFFSVMVVSSGNRSFDPAVGKALDEPSRERGVRLLRISEGFHAKFLLWGDDDIVVTSINWCSWTSPPDAPFGEIGVHISRPGLARQLAERLPLIWSQL